MTTLEIIKIAKYSVFTLSALFFFFAWVYLPAKTMLAYYSCGKYYLRKFPADTKEKLARAEKICADAKKEDDESQHEWNCALANPTSYQDFRACKGVLKDEKYL